MRRRAGFGAATAPGLRIGGFLVSPTATTRKVVFLRAIAIVDGAGELRLRTRKSRVFHGGEATRMQLREHGIDAVAIETVPGVARAAAGAQHQRPLGRLLD